jgi:hypothetical protein
MEWRCHIKEVMARRFDANVVVMLTCCRGNDLENVVVMQWQCQCIFLSRHGDDVCYRSAGLLKRLHDVVVTY